jgi:hypothetical protein
MSNAKDDLVMQFLKDD